MLRAWQLHRVTEASFAASLSKAWELYRLIREMRTGVVSFCYEKAGGTFRRAKGTLRDIAPLIKGTGIESPKTVRYYDVEARGFRSFRVENFITVY